MQVWKVLQLRLPKKVVGAPPQFSAHVYYGQTAGWITMAHGVELGLGPGHIVIGGDPAAIPKKGAQPPSFSAHFYIVIMRIFLNTV